MDTFEPIRLHPEASKTFNEKAEALLPLLSEVPVLGPEVGGFKPQIHPRANLTGEDIVGGVKVGLMDGRGMEYGKLFEHDGKTFGLVGRGFKDLQTLAGRIQETESVRPYISVQRITECGFEWLRRRHGGNTSEPFIEFALREASSQVGENEIWHPLYHVFIQSDLVVGKVVFKTLTPKMFGRWDQIPEGVPQEQRAAIHAAIGARRSKLQGCAAATIKLIAEPLRAEELSMQEAERSIACLRFFHPANLSPYIRSFCTTTGKENLSMTSALLVRDGQIVRSSEKLNTRSGTTWMIPDEEIREIRAVALDSLSRMLLGEKTSPFEQELLDAILVYSRNSLFDDPLNRLIYILSALESLLLRDKNEPIQKNLAERLAFIVGVTIEEREKVRDNATRVYGLRSEFLHHGKGTIQMEELESFMLNVWKAFVALIHNVDRFPTRQDLIVALERRKMA